MEGMSRVVGDRMQAQVVVVEDALVAREGLVAVLEALPGTTVVGTAADAASAHEVIQRERPDVVLADLRMPPGHHAEGVTLANDLRVAMPDVGVIVVSQHCDPGMARLLFANGAARRGYLLKERITSPEVLADAIATVAGGGTTIDPSIVAGMVVDGRGRPGSAINALTPREAEVLELLAAGQSNTAIARHMSISRRGVEKNVTQIFAKLGLGQDDDRNARVSAAILWLDGRDGLRETRTGISASPDGAAP